MLNISDLSGRWLYKIDFKRLSKELEPTIFNQSLQQSL